MQKGLPHLGRPFCVNALVYMTLQPLKNLGLRLAVLAIQPG